MGDVVDLASELVIPLIDSIDVASAEKNPVDRYFLKLYSCEEHLCYMFHTNRVCVVTLSRFHPLIRAGKSVAEVRSIYND